MKLETLRKKDLQQIAERAIEKDPSLLEGMSIKIAVGCYNNIFREDVKKALKTIDMETFHAYQIQNAVYCIVKGCLEIKAMAELETREQYERAKEVTNGLFEVVGCTCRI